MTLGSLCAALRRRRARIIMPVVMFAAIALLGWATRPERYRATAEIQVLKADGGAFGLESNVSGQGASGAATDSLDFSMTLQTKAAILRSPILADKVIASTGLEHTPDYFGSSSGKLPSRFVALPWHKPFEPLSVPLAQAPNRRYAAERIFKGHLKVQPVAGTRLLDVSYTDRDPLRAARVANAAVQALVEEGGEQRMALQGAPWLKGQLEDLRTRAEDAQARAAELERGTGVFGSDASRNVVLERLDSLNQTLTAAESNRILKESVDRVAASSSPELISSLSGNSSTGSVASVNSSLTLIQGLRQQEAQVRADLAEKSVRYGPAYPRVAELQAQLNGITDAVAAETTRLGQRAHTDFLVAAQAEEAARAAFEKQKELAARQNSSVLAYRLAREEADNASALYEGLQAKSQQASLLEGLRASDVAVVSPAQEPPPNRPSSPSLPLWLGAGLGAGLLLGVLLAGLAELMDTSLHGPAQLEAHTGTPLLAVLPALPGRGRLRLKRDGGPGIETLLLQTPPFAEAVRSLRTALVRAHGEPGCQVILLTSCVAHEGKTTVAKGLAAALAFLGSRVLLIDADLRRPSLHLLSPKANRAGFASALGSEAPALWEQPFPQWPGLHLLAGSETPAMASELLASPRLARLLKECRAEHDYILIDAPPVLPVTDAVLLAAHCDRVVLVARHEKTTLRSLDRSLEILRQGSVPIGVVWNGIPAGSGEYREYFGYGGGPYAASQA